MLAFDKKYLSAILAIAFSAMMLPDLMRLPTIYAIPSVVYLLAFNFCVMYIISQVRGLASILIPPIFFISALTSYFHGIYRIKIDKELLFLLLETNSGEAGEFVTSKLLMFGAIALLFSFIFGYLLKRSTGKFQLKTLALLLLFIVPATVLLGKFKKTPQVQTVRPVVAIKYVFPYCVFNGLAEFSGQYAKNITQNELIGSAELDSLALKQETPLQVIVIIGESARADRFHFNGYPRETTPRLSNEKNFVNFGAITSFAAYTRLSVPAMITPATLAKPETTMNSYLGVFKKHGFKTTWLSANDRFTSNDTPTTNAIGEIDQKLFRNKFGRASYNGFYDAMLLEPLKGVLKNASVNQAITIHTRGSHANYAARYTKEFRKFIPDSYGEDMQIEMVNNAYDNSILATDAFIGSIIDLVRDKNAIVIYSSDHGESLGEEGRFGHGDPDIIEQREVPFFVWYSNTYNLLNPDIVAALKKQQGAKLSHDVFFPWVINLGGILLPHSTQPVLIKARNVQALQE